MTNLLDPLMHEGLSRTLAKFDHWLTQFGETSYDHQSFYAGAIGGAAKALYYRRQVLGVLAVAPMVFCEAFVPSARRLFHTPMRFPIADAHYAMAYLLLYQATGDASWLQKGRHFLAVLRRTRCPGFEEYCWGYPFDWVTRNGTIPAQTPLITTTPYVYEAFALAQRLDPSAEWMAVLTSIARHVQTDIKEFPVSPNAASCSYTPYDGGGVINAAAYRAFLLASASRDLDMPAYWAAAERNLNFVLDAQNPDGSWYYAIDGVRDFVDHFHTCFVMKALAKIHSLTGHQRTLAALERGVAYYCANLFDADGLPKPFSKAPRLTVYKRELYDCAECINLCLLLRDRFPVLDETLTTVVAGILNDWVKPDGSFRSRQLHVGWDTVPMHRWAQSQMFRSLALLLASAGKRASGCREDHAADDQRCAGEPVLTV